MDGRRTVGRRKGAGRKKDNYDMMCIWNPNREAHHLLEKNRRAAIYETDRGFDDWQ